VRQHPKRASIHSSVGIHLARTLFRQLTNICHKIKYYVRSPTNATSRIN